jgi:uncharacterized YccA/Bax inhibitor family protein
VTTGVPGPVAKKRFPTPVQAVILVFAGLAMAFFGCLGALSQYEGSNLLFGILLVVAILGAIAFLIGMSIILVMFVQGVMRAIRDSRQKTPPPRDGGAPPSDVTGTPRD